MSDKIREMRNRSSISFFAVFEHIGQLQGEFFLSWACEVFRGADCALRLGSRSYALLFRAWIRSHVRVSEMIIGLISIALLPERRPLWVFAFQSIFERKGREQ